MLTPRVIISLSFTGVLSAAVALPVPASADEPPHPPGTGFALILTAASGDTATVGSRGKDIPPLSSCGHQWEYVVPVHIWSSPSGSSGNGGPDDVMATAPIPPGKHTLAFFSYCSPYNIYRVDFAVPP